MHDLENKKVSCIYLLTCKDFKFNSCFFFPMILWWLFFRLVHRLIELFLVFNEKSNIIRLILSYATIVTMECCKYFQNFHLDLHEIKLLNKLTVLFSYSGNLNQVYQLGIHQDVLWRYLINSCVFKVKQGVNRVSDFSRRYSLLSLFERTKSKEVIFSR